MAKTAAAAQDTPELTPEQQRKIARVLKPRNSSLSLKFAEEFIERWKASAQKANLSLSDWVEEALNAAADKSDKLP